MTSLQRCSIRFAGAVWLLSAVVPVASAQTTAPGERIGDPAPGTVAAGTRLGGPGRRPLGGPGGVRVESPPVPAAAPTPRPRSPSAFEEVARAIDRSVDPD